MCDKNRLIIGHRLYVDQPAAFIYFGCIAKVNMGLYLGVEVYFLYFPPSDKPKSFLKKMWVEKFGSLSRWEMLSKMSFFL
jgi:hypothetical protein